MRAFTFFFSLILSASVLTSCKVKTQNEPRQITDITEFAGQWTIDIEGGQVGWLEVRQEDNYLDADLLWIGGSVIPANNVYFTRNQTLVVTRSNQVVRKKDANNNPVRSHVITNWLEIRKHGDNIAGYLFVPRGNGMGVDSTSFVGTKLPPVSPAPDPARLKYGNPIALFNGKDLSGWRLTDEKQKNGFKVIGGVIINDPVQIKGEPHISYGNIRTEQVFEDFNLKLDVNVPEGSNSGIYLRGMYEIQVLDSYGTELDSHNMGAVYSRIKPIVNAEKPANTWQTIDITLCNRHITVILNGTKIIDNQPVSGPTGGAIISNVFAPGPIYLQGDHGKVMYRNIMLTPIISNE